MPSPVAVRGRFYAFSMIIDCNSCAIPALGRQHECSECVVTHLLAITGPTAEAIPSPEHLAALEILVDSGLVPASRHLPATG